MLKGFLSNIFGKVVETRNNKYDNKEELTKCKVPVISIGNLSVGGTGKTPFVDMLTRFFESKNIKVGIVGRGYKRKSKGEIIVCDGKNVLVDADTGGDEMVLLADALRVPVIAHDSKSLAAKSMDEKFKVDIILVDDGFQHRELHRDLDIVLVDRETAENPELLPKGKLREPLSSLKRADIVCFTSAGIEEFINPFIDPTTITIKVKPIQTAPYNLDPNKRNEKVNVRLLKEGMIGFAGIAKPERFYDMLKANQYKFVETISFDDHHNYTLKDLEKLKELANKHKINYLCTTAKDASKLIKFNEFFKENNLDCYVIPISLHITDGKDGFFRAINNLIRKKNEKN